MKEPNFREILKGKMDHYGNTEAAIQFAAEEYHRQMVHYEKIPPVPGIPKKRKIHEGSLQKWASEGRRQANKWFYNLIFYVGIFLLLCCIGIMGWGLIYRIC